MTYIKWKDEVESYLGELSAEEREKIFGYFAEMYADKRDAGIPEREIIENFGAPYDVAKRILAEREPESGREKCGASSFSGGNGCTQGVKGDSYSYNYNYNYAPPPPPQPVYYAQTPPSYQHEEEFVADMDLPLDDVKGAKKKHKPLRALALFILLAIPAFIASVVIVSVGIALFASSLGCIVGGFAEVGQGFGVLVSKGGVLAAAYIGEGLICVGAGFMLLPLCALVCKWLGKALIFIFKKISAAI